MNGGHRRAPATAVAKTLATAFLAACADDGGGDSTPAPTLPPIATTGPPTTAVTATGIQSPSPLPPHRPVPHTMATFAPSTQGTF